jgi:hypothetical protein
MQYVLLIYQGTTPLPGSPEWEALPAAEQKAIYADYAAVNRTPGVSAGPPLGLPEHAATVRVNGGGAVTSDGPFSGNTEPLGGFIVFEAEDLDAAIALAARIPAARHGGAVEVRPSATYW